MRRILTFDAFASQGDVAYEATASLRAIPGILSSEVLAAATGQPAFCILIETDDAQDAEVGRRLDAGIHEYAEFLGPVTHRAFRKIG